MNPSSIADPAANYHHAVLVENPTRWLHTSGVVPTAPDGSTPNTLEVQAKVVWDNIAAMLAAADMLALNIVSVTTYVVSGEPLGPVMAATRRISWRPSGRKHTRYGSSTRAASMANGSRRRGRELTACDYLSGDDMVSGTVPSYDH